MNVLLTGGSGFIGSNLVRLLLAERPGWRVVNLDKLTYAGNRENLADLEGDPRYRFVRGDICNGELVADVFRTESIDAVMHLAAESHVDRSILAPAVFIDTNVRGTQVLLEAARECGVKRFLHVSTDEVYGSLGPDGPLHRGDAARSRRPRTPPPRRRATCSRSPTRAPSRSRSSSRAARTTTGPTSSRRSSSRS